MRILLLVLVFLAGLVVAITAPRRDTTGENASPEEPSRALSAPVAEQEPADVPAAGSFVRKPPPKPGEWLGRFEVPGQTFEEYVDSEPVRAESGDFLAFLPIGPFSGLEHAVLRRTVKFAGIWFDLETKALDAIPVPVHVDRRDVLGWTQLRTVPILRRVLPHRRPENAVCLLGVTMSDLYPADDWHFVFGQATLFGRVGIYSFSRYFAGFWGKAETAQSRLRALRRACRLIVHETGHTFGLEHCRVYMCTMNGSNTLRESDSQPLHLCPDCLRKLRWNRGFDADRRYERLGEFFEEQGLRTEARWVRGRLARTGK